jgi:hypothetical protein
MTTPTTPLAWKQARPDLTGIIDALCASDASLSQMVEIIGLVAVAVPVAAPTAPAAAPAPAPTLRATPRAAPTTSEAPQKQRGRKWDRAVARAVAGDRRWSMP